MKRILIIIGTRPEAIKMCPVIKELRKHKEQAETKLCVTGQHREMLEQVLEIFNEKPDFDLAIMKENQTLFDITSEILIKLKDVLQKVQPDLVMVHGDTSTTFAAALAAFYFHIPIAHVEAGLRTYDLTAPFPEEFNRQAVGIVAKYNFAPTIQARDNLLKEGKNPQSIFVTGNTAIDALKTTIRTDYTHPELEWAQDSTLILMTAHRRENIGEPMRQIFLGVQKVLRKYDNVKVIYPVHKNPIIRDMANEIFMGEERIHIIEPLDVIDFHNFMNHSYLILTDSGGVQEEAPSLGKPVLVMRETTERPEGVLAGTLRLIGTDENLILDEVSRLIDDSEQYRLMSKASNPYGDGTASKKIVDIIFDN